MYRKNSGYRIGCYIRVSTEEQAQNLEGSIRNQEERLKAHVKLKNMESDFGKIESLFIDRAKSGKDTNRAELQKLLNAIRHKEIDLVLVTELSRISRSMKNFAEIWELMQNSGCGFQSLRENFDTTTAAGEMVLFSVANIAQFERRQVSERVSLNLRARAKRGLYNGGCVAFGYELISGKPGYLKTNQDHAKVIQKAYEAFLREETLQQTAKWLNENNYRLSRQMKGGGRTRRLDFFTVDNLHHILRNKTYVGVKTYVEDGTKKEAKAVWEPLIDRGVFDRVQKMLDANRSRKKPHTAKRFPYLLTGITFCAKCGDPLSGKSAWGRARKIPYYEHSWSTKRNSTLSQKTFDCGAPRRFLAKKLEGVVLNEVEKLVTTQSFAKELLAEAKKVYETSQGLREWERLKAQIYGYTSQLEALAERLSQLPKTVSAAPVFKQMEKLESAKAQAEERIEGLSKAEQRTSQPPMNLKDYTIFLESLRSLMIGDNPVVKAKIIKRLIHRIEVGEREVRIHYNVGNTLLREPLDLGSRLFLHPKQGKVIEWTKKSSDQEDPVAAQSFFYQMCSNSLTIGAPKRT